jgi:GNAT superfamily N-acetyltransferase
MTAPRRFDASYREELTLRDGTHVELRLVRPSDKPLFTEGFSRLSPASRYLRFFTSKESLTEGELRYLTEVDGEDHLAIGASTIVNGRELGLGVARFVRLAAEPEVAELAVTVVDAAQHKGLGKALSVRAIEAARERGIRRCRAEILASNAAVLSLIRELPIAVQHEEDGCVVVDLMLPEASSAAAPTPRGLVDQLLALAARGLIAVRRAFEPHD